MLGAVAVFAAGLSIALWATDALENPEFSLVDARFSIRGEQDAPADVVVVAIDDKTFDQLGERFPFPRSRHAQAIDRLRRAGAKVIAYDIQFTEPTEPKEDQALGEAAQRAGNVVFATTETDKQGGTNVLGGDEVLAQIGARAGNASLVPDSDGVIRRVPFAIQKLKSFAVTVAEAFSGEPIERADFGSWSTLIDYPGPPGTVRTVSFSDLVEGRVPPEALRGKAVVVGPSSPTLQDVHPTSASGSRLMPGAEIQADSVATVLAGLPLEYAPGWLDAFLIALMACVAPAAGLRLGPAGRSALIALGAGLLFLVGAQLAFDSGLWWSWSTRWWGSRWRPSGPCS